MATRASDLTPADLAAGRRWWAQQKAERGPAPEHVVAAVNRALRVSRTAASRATGAAS